MIYAIDTNIESVLIDNDFVEARLNESTGNNFNLFSSLNEQVSTSGYFDWDSFASVASPNVQTWVSRSAVNCSNYSKG